MISAAAAKRRSAASPLEIEPFSPALAEVPSSAPAEIAALAAPSALRNARLSTLPGGSAPWPSALASRAENKARSGGWTAFNMLVPSIDRSCSSGWMDFKITDFRRRRFISRRASQHERPHVYSSEDDRKRINS